jgi:hypothetical protein
LIIVIILGEEAPHYEFFSILLSFHPSLVQISSYIYRGRIKHLGNGTPKCYEDNELRLAILDVLSLFKTEATGQLELELRKILQSQKVCEKWEDPDCDGWIKLAMINEI